MNNESLCHMHDGLYGSFSTSILVLGANTRERLSLTFLSATARIILGREDAIVTMIMFYFGDTLVPKPLFKACLSHNSVGFVSTQGDLVLDPYH